MGDRTSVQLFMYSCPPQQTWAIAEAIERWGLTDDMTGSYRPSIIAERIVNGIGTGMPGAPIEVGPGPWDLGYLEPGERYLGNDVNCGSADEIRDFLQTNAPDARWDVWEDPKYDWLGARFIHDPDLGTWTEECDANGAPCYPLESVNAWLDKALACSVADRDAVREQIDRERGKPWLEMVGRPVDKRIIAIGPDPDDVED